MNGLSWVMWYVLGEVCMFAVLYIVSAWYIYLDSLKEPAGSVKRRIMLRQMNAHEYVLSDTGAQVASGMAVDLWKKLQALPVMVVVICMVVM